MYGWDDIWQDDKFETRDQAQAMIEDHVETCKDSDIEASLDDFKIITKWKDTMKQKWICEECSSKFKKSWVDHLLDNVVCDKCYKLQVTNIKERILSVKEIDAGE